MGGVEDEREDSVQILANCGSHQHVVRRVDGEVVSHGTLRPAVEGQPLGPNDEFVHLRARDGEPGVFDVTSHAGPPRAATPKYRSGYDRIFRKKPKAAGGKKLDPKLN